MIFISAMNFFPPLEFSKSGFWGDKTHGSFRAWLVNSYCCFFQYNRAFIVSFHNKDANNKPGYSMHTVPGAVCMFFLPSLCFI